MIHLDAPLQPRSTPQISACALLAAFALFGCSIERVRSAQAIGGRADLSHGPDFDGGELVRLDGRWELYRGELLGPSDFRGASLPAPALAPVPGIWAENQGFVDSPDPPTGIGTLRLRLRIPPGGREWALRLPNADSATRVFVNGAEVAEIGRVSDSPALFIPSNGIAIPRFFASDGELDLIMQVANFAAPVIGTWDSPILGVASAVLQKRQKDVALTSLISGALLIMGLYHLSLFLLRKKDLSSLLFGIICLLMTTRNMIMGERLLLEFFPLGRASWEWAFKLETFGPPYRAPFRPLFPPALPAPDPIPSWPR